MSTWRGREKIYMYFKQVISDGQTDGLTDHNRAPAEQDPYNFS